MSPFEVAMIILALVVALWLLSSLVRAKKG